jgi:hypothetical protein
MIMSRTWNWTDKAGTEFTLRSSKPKRELRNVESVETVDCYFEVEAFDHELNVNTVDPAMDIDGSAEFGDHDDITQGLTLVEPDGVLATASFLNGYGVE